MVPGALRLLGKGDNILIAGEKSARRARGESSFHLVERGYGRFARVVRLSRSCDTSKARATLLNGELRISIPKIADRRGSASHHDHRPWNRPRLSNGHVFAAPSALAFSI